MVTSSPHRGIFLARVSQVSPRGGGLKAGAAVVLPILESDGPTPLRLSSKTLATQLPSTRIVDEAQLGPAKGNLQRLAERKPVAGLLRRVPIHVEEARQECCRGKKVDPWDTR